MRADDTTLLVGDTLFSAGPGAGELGYAEVRSQIVEVIGMLTEVERN